MEGSARGRGRARDDRLVFVSHQGFGITPAAAEEIVVTEGQIARLHAALRLTAAQERHWYPVAATLRRLGHQRQRSGRLR